MLCVDPSPQFVQCPIVVDDIIGACEPLLAGCLCRHDRPDRFPAATVARGSPGDLVVFRAIHDQDPVNQVGLVGLQQQRDDHNAVRCINSCD